MERGMYARLYRIGAICSALQLTTIIAYIFVSVFIGPRITGAEGFYFVQQSSF